MRNRTVKDRLCLLGIRLLCVCGLIVGGIAAIFILSLFTSFNDFVGHPATAAFLGVLLGFTFCIGAAMANVLLWVVSGAGFLERLFDDD